MVTTYNLDSDAVGLFCNKMFIISAALGVANRNNDKVILPKWRYENIYKNKIEVSESFPPVTYWQEPGFHYTPIEYKKNMSLKGYFQSYKYFQDCENLVRYHLEPNDEITKYIDDKYGKMLEKETVSIHVRRGDYLKYPNHHPQCTIEYYKQSIMKVTSIEQIFIFSDDINWCKENFGVKENVIYPNENKFIDFFTMSRCKHNIIANSTYSWWAAWLNKNKNKKVICPKIWFGPAYSSFKTDDLRPLEWEQI